MQIKRAYDPPHPADGARILVERLWPRGIKKQDLKLDQWLKEVAPSTELRKWFQHQPEKWPEFQERYRQELDAHPAAWQAILDTAAQGPVTLIYSSSDTQRNSTVVLYDYLKRQS